VDSQSMRRRGSRSRPACRPTVQPLETRQVLSSFTAVPLGFNIATTLPLTDGRLLAQDGGSPTFHLLSPTAGGSYASPSDAVAAPSIDPRFYYGSAVLKDGRVLFSGAEYGTGKNKIEIYDPNLNSWTAVADPSFFPGQIGDNDIKVMTDGTVLAGDGGGDGVYGLYNPTTKAWTQVAGLPTGWQNESSLAMLPDGSIFTLSTGGNGGPDQGFRYVPSLNRWVSAGMAPVRINTGEGGPIVQLPDGKLFFTADNINSPGGATHQPINTAIYTRRRPRPGPDRGRSARRSRWRRTRSPATSPWPRCPMGMSS